MKFSVATYTFIGAILGQSVAGTAFPRLSNTRAVAAQERAERWAPKSLESRQANVDWRFSLFQNAQCHGVSDTKEGTGTTGCMTGILNGNAPAFQRSLSNF